MRLIGLIICLLSFLLTQAQQGIWRAELERKDSNAIVFNFEWKNENGKPIWYIKNGAEKLRVPNITKQGDSFFVQMPVFESQFRFAITAGILKGVWIKRGALKSQTLAFTATKNSERFTSTAAAAKNISGRWAVGFKGANASVGEFIQKGNVLTGTFLNADGDYRYLEGVVTNDTLLLSGFDGGHCFLFKAIIINDTAITNGQFYSGATSKESWTATKNKAAKVPEENVAMHVKLGQDKLDFTFKDLEQKPVSINDDRFKNKVVIIQLMGSWCPNCMDETAFLSDYYNHNKQRGIEIIALAYEYTTDWERSKKSLQKFQQNFKVQYPILNTGVTVTDSLRTQKTLPQISDIKSFPSVIIIDKKGKIRKLDTNFNGPGTGVHYVEYKKEFEATINQLLKEN